MLHPEGVSRSHESDIKPHTDEGLRSTRAKLMLATRMWLAGMIGTIDVQQASVDIFTAVKKMRAPIDDKDLKVNAQRHVKDGTGDTR